MKAERVDKLEGLEVYEVRPLANDIYKGIHVEWSAPQLGWGQWTLVWSDEDGKFHIDSECMDGEEQDNREFSKSILMKILEGCVIDD